MEFSETQKNKLLSSHLIILSLGTVTNATEIDSGSYIHLYLVSGLLNTV